jgi:hypothetical protein
MPGELWRRVAQVAKETVAGTAVVATRKVYWRDVVFTNEQEPQPQMFDVGRRDNVLEFTKGSKAIGGSATMPVGDELLEWLLTGVAGGVTPTQPSAGPDPTVYLWTFKPGNTLDTMTVEYYDGARAWIVNGVNVNSLQFAGNVNGENLVNAEFFARDMVTGSLATGLTERIPNFIQGWETKLYLDDFGGTPGTTVVPGTLINWEVNFNNNMTREYFADNTQAAGDISSDTMTMDARLTFRASSSAALTEFNNWNANAKRMFRLEFGQNKVISNAFKRFVTLDMPGAWSAVGLGGNENNRRTYELNMQYVYDPTLAAGMQIRLQNTRSVAWAA